MITEKEIQELAKKQSQTAMFLSDFPHHERSVAYGFIAGFKKCQEINEPKWIGVEEELMPSFEEKTQIICANGDQYIGYFNGADTKGYVWFCDNNDYHYPTHWQPLPTPPSNG